MKKVKSLIFNKHVMKSSGGEEVQKAKVVPVLNLIKHYAMKAYGGVDV
jgi:hypothetical protein